MARDEAVTFGTRDRNPPVAPKLDKILDIIKPIVYNKYICNGGLTMEWKTITSDELKSLIDTHTYVALGKMFGISDTAVKGKAKRFGIWTRKNKYNGHNDHLKVIKACEWCGGVRAKNKGKFCSKQCHSDYQYHEYINKWLLDIVDGCRENTIWRVSDRVRRYLWNKYDGKCSRCGWDTPNPHINKVILEIEHIDGDCTNNKEDNLDLICPNCHSLTSTYRALNIGNGNRDRLKSKGLIK
jgi:Zn finger protein HypA/HybF involved in hydrogenase expression